MANRPIQDDKYIAVLNHSGTHRVQWAQTIALDLAYMLCNWRSLTVVRDSLEHTITSTQEKEKGGAKNFTWHCIYNIPPPYNYQK